jgi:uncharacterized protein (DUF342 family)
MKAQSSVGPSASEQSIEELQKRYQKLHERKIKAETNLDHSQRELARLQQEAREKYGTDDVDQLRQKLNSMKNDNDEKRRKYQADLDGIESELEAVEQNFVTHGNSGSEEE